jgi:2-dehydro-3-deoxyphosphooctonate aldolase (KDO 8-P synthase)|tara:strand:- start:10735 stop:11520 length:786 start_codon:yes stop_codon:yes gene_type:complete
MKNNYNFKLIAGPCVVEDEKTVFETSKFLKKVCADNNIELIFKSSYKKANRTKYDSFTGIEPLRALEILKAVKDDLNIPVITDIHETKDVEMVRNYVSHVQIPAFLCRQTDLLIAAGESGLTVNIKKGQFASHATMEHAYDKVKQTGNDKILITERGNTFGYSDLVVDITNVPKLKLFCDDVFVDCTHSLQKPNQRAGVTGGDPKLISTMCYASIAAGATGLFIETHPNPSEALSDSLSMLPLREIESIINKSVKIKQAIS